MAGATCGWRRCTRPARLVLLVGEVPEAADPRGAYCVRHAAVKRQTVQQQVAAPVWLDWAEPAPYARRLVGQGPQERILHRHVRQRLDTRS